MQKVKNFYQKQTFGKTKPLVWIKRKNKKHKKKKTKKTKKIKTQMIFFHQNDFCWENIPPPREKQQERRKSPNPEQEFVFFFFLFSQKEKQELFFKYFMASWLSFFDHWKLMFV